MAYEHKQINDEKKLNNITRELNNLTIDRNVLVNYKNEEREWKDNHYIIFYVNGYKNAEYDCKPFNGKWNEEDDRWEFSSDTSELDMTEIEQYMTERHDSFGFAAVKIM